MAFKVGGPKKEKIRSGFGRVASAFQKVGSGLADMKKDADDKALRNMRQSAKRDRAELRKLKARDNLEEYKAKRKKTDVWGF